MVSTFTTRFQSFYQESLMLPFYFCTLLGKDVALGLACAVNTMFGGITGKYILFPTLQKHILDWQHSSGHPKPESGLGTVCLQLVSGTMLAAEKKAQMEAGLQPQSCLPTGQVSSGEEQTGRRCWQRSQSAGLMLDKARAMGESVLLHVDKVCRAVAKRCDPAPDSRQHPPLMGDSVRFLPCEVSPQVF